MVISMRYENDLRVTREIKTTKGNEAWADCGDFVILERKKDGSIDELCFFNWAEAANIEAFLRLERLNADACDDEDDEDDKYDLTP